MVINNKVKNNSNRYWIDSLLAFIFQNHLLFSFYQTYHNTLSFKSWRNEICCSHQLADDHRNSLTPVHLKHNLFQKINRRLWSPEFVDKILSREFVAPWLFQIENEFSLRNNVLILKSFCNDCILLFSTGRRKSNIFFSMNISAIIIYHSLRLSHTMMIKYCSILTFCSFFNR